VDDDGDGLVDAADPGCDDPDDESERSPDLPCDNGLDDDDDGHVDLADPGCFDGSWPTESPACQDGIDNDGAIGTDYDGGESILGAGNGDPEGADPECVGRPWRTKETAGKCGLGVEPALILAGLPWLRGRRRGARSIREA